MVCVGFKEDFVGSEAPSTEADKMAVAGSNEVESGIRLAEVAAWYQDGSRVMLRLLGGVGDGQRGGGVVGVVMRQKPWT